jgi:hypothetical protein
MRLPTIYADMNVYRYVACGDIAIKDPERFIWVYSYVHLDEIHRNGNADALIGMESLGAVEIADMLDEKFQSIGNVVLKQYVDPYTRYEKYLEDVSQLGNVRDHMLPHLTRYFGANNFSELSKTPDQMYELIDRIANMLDEETRASILNKAQSVSIEMKKSIESSLKDQRPIDTTRQSLGLSNVNRKIAENSHSHIDAILALIPQSKDGFTNTQLLGFEPIPGLEGMQLTQHTSIAGMYQALNLHGLYPDLGLTKDKKMKNTLSDGEHVGMASYCNALLSADEKLCSKARAIYVYKKSTTTAVHFTFQPGSVLDLGIQENGAQ